MISTVKCGYCGRDHGIIIRAYIDNVPCCMDCYEEMKCKGEI